MDNILKWLNNQNNLKNPVILEKIHAFLKKKCSFTLSGLTAFLRLLLVADISKEKKIIFVVNTEQTALKYKHDLEKLFDIKSEIFPYQDVSLYDGVSQNLYRYAKQMEILQNIENINVLIAPVKSLLEKFPSYDFFKKYLINIKIDDEIDTSKMAQSLVDMGYKRVTMVSDIGEFSIRGDIIDVFSIDRYASRIELWGDTVTDIRYFDNKTQRSIKKTKETTILPVYKFVLSKENSETFKNELINATVCTETGENADLIKEMLEETLEKIDNEKYFEGIEYFQSYINKKMKSVIELLPEDFSVIFDESSEIFSKLAQIDENYSKQIEENTQKALALPLKNKAHLEFDDFQNVIAKREKIFFDRVPIGRSIFLKS